MAKVQSVKEILLDDNWWMKVDYIFAFIAPIYDVLRKKDIEMIDSIIEKVRKLIFEHERKKKLNIHHFSR